MSYAVKADGTAWRAIASEADILPGEVFSETQPALIEPVLTYADKRRAEYPPASDYLDAIVKNDEAQKQEYINKCLAVKAKYPKA
jgi:hypothetical protein